MEIDPVKQAFWMRRVEDKLNGITVLASAAAFCSFVALINTFMR